MVTNNTDIILGCMVHNDNGLINNHQAKSERPSAKVSKKIQILVCVCVCVCCVYMSLGVWWVLAKTTCLFLFLFCLLHSPLFVFVLLLSFCFVFVHVVSCLFPLKHPSHQVNIVCMRCGKSVILVKVVQQ